MVYNLSNVEKHDEHALGRVAALPRLLRSWGSWALPLRRLLFSLGIIPIDPTIVPSDEPRHEGEALDKLQHGALSVRGSEAWVQTLRQRGACSNHT